MELIEVIKGKAICIEGEPFNFVYFVRNGEF